MRHDNSHMTTQEEKGRVWIWCSDCTKKSDPDCRICKDCYLKCDIPEKYRVIKQEK